jgi:outer membrane autotransporter protein
MNLRRHTFPRFRLQLAVFTTLVLVAISASGALAQQFDKVISNVISGGCVGLNPTGNLAGRCGAGVPGASGGSTTALSQETAPVQERQIQRLIGPLNLYFAGDYERFHKDVTSFEPGYHTDTWRALAGADYSVTNNLLFGGAFRYVRDDGDFRGGGDFATNSYGFLLHTNYVPAPQWFLDASGGYMRRNYSIDRAIFFNPGTGNTFIGNAHGEPDGNEAEAALHGGYDFTFQNVTIGPRVGLNYQYDEIDNYTEHGNTGLELKYSNQHQNSFTTTLGVQGTLAISTGIGVLVPQALAEYVHEFLDPQRRIGFRFAEDLNAVPFRFQNDAPDRNYFNLGAGAVLQLAHGVAPFLNYRALVGYHHEYSHRVTAGLRVEF